MNTHAISSLPNAGLIMVKRYRRWPHTESASGLDPALAGHVLIAVLMLSAHRSSTTSESGSYVTNIA